MVHLSFLFCTASIRSRQPSFARHFCRRTLYSVRRNDNVPVSGMASEHATSAENGSKHLWPWQKTLYPRINPYFAGHLEVSHIHRVYYEISGNPNGLPICFVHGGPGGGTVPAHRRFFDPEVYKIIMFDQRGCGKSTPIACLEENTTWDLISDMEAVREAAEVERWLLFGGSWGSTLAVAYAQTNPDRVIAMILRGIFLIRQQELEWLYERSGAAMLYPEAFERYVSGLPEELRTAKSLMHAYYGILSRNEASEERRIAANAWSNWEHTLSSFPRRGEEDEDEKTDYDEDETLAFARIECHFFVNKGWLKEDGFLLCEEQMKKIRHIRTCIVQGRWDVVCPRKTAYDLAKRMKSEKVETVLVELAGHSTFEPGIEAALLNASDRFGKELRWMSGAKAGR